MSESAPTFPALDSARAESLVAYLLLRGDAPQSGGRWRSCCGPTPARPRRGPTCATSCTPSAATCRVPTATWRSPAGPCGGAPSAVRLDVAEFERFSTPGTAADRGAMRRRRRLGAARGGRAVPRRPARGVRRRVAAVERERLRHRTGGVDRARGSVGGARAGRRRRSSRAAPARIRCARRPTGADPGARRARRSGRAMRAYHGCATTLERELGVRALRRDAAGLPGPAVGRSQAAAPEARAVRPALVGRAPSGPRWSRPGARPRPGRRGSSWSAASRDRQDPARRGAPRLVRAAAGATAAEARCYAAEGPLAYGPVVAWLRSRRCGRPGPAGPGPAHRARPSAAGAARPGTRTLRGRVRCRSASSGSGCSTRSPRPCCDRAARAARRRRPPAADRDTCQLAALPAAGPSGGAPARGGDGAQRGPRRRPRCASCSPAARERDRLTEMALGRLAPDETPALAERLAGAPLDAAATPSGCSRRQRATRCSSSRRVRAGRPRSAG